MKKLSYQELQLLIILASGVYTVASTGLKTFSSWRKSRRLRKEIKKTIDDIMSDEAYLELCEEMKHSL